MRDHIVTLNMGLGRDSITMLCLCIEGKLRSELLGVIRPEDLDAVIFSDTGCEWRHTYEVITAVQALCFMHDIPFVVLERSGKYHYRGASVMDDFVSRQTVASIGKGDCTDNNKIQPIRRWMNDRSVERFGLNNRQYSNRVRKGERQKHVNLIGIAADETSRLDNGAGRTPAYVEEAYPLVDMGISKPDEAVVLERWGLNHVRKSGCIMCPFQPVSWYWALRETDPERWADVVEYERMALARNPRMAATGAKLKGQPMTLPEAVRRWRLINPEATVDAVLDKQYSRCVAAARAAQRAEMEAS